MKVIILCGGKGTRLREETEFRPKPMVPIGNRPILWHIMKSYASHGYKDFVVCLGYKGEMIKDYFRNYLWNISDVTLTLGRKPGIKIHNHHTEEDWTVTLADTGHETFTAGRIARVKKYVGDEENFFLTYGDIVADINIPASLEYHKQHGKVMTLTAVRPPGRFGELGVTEKGHVQQFNEKPQASEGRINGGYMVASRKLFDYLGDDADQMMLEQKPMQRLTREGELMAFPHNGFWYPMDTFAEFNLLNKLWDDGKAPWKVW